MIYYNVSYCHCLCQFFHSDPSNCSYRFIVHFQTSCKPCIHSESLKFWRNSLRRPAISHVYCMLKATLAFHCFEMIQTRNQKDSAWGWLWVAFEHLSNHAMLVEGNGVPCTMVPSSLEVKWIVDPGWPITCWADHNLEITNSSLHPSRYHPCLDTHAMDPSVIQVLLWILLLDVVLLI